MRISAKADYACRSLLELALHWPNQVPLQVNEIAQRQGIPLKFLIHILINLKHSGLVKSTRGKRGGYSLAKAPAEIKLGDILRSLEGESPSAATLKKKANQDVMTVVWGEVDNAVSGIMRNISFEDICNRARTNNMNFVYEI